MYIDLGAERILAAEREGEKIAVEIKSFFKTSAISEFHTALGQFINYRLALSEQEPDRTLYLAVPIDTYTSFFTIRLVQNIIKTYQLKLITYKPVIPFHEMSDTNNQSLILSPCSLLPAPLLPRSINLKVKRYNGGDSRMDKLKKYQQIIQQLLQEYAAISHQEPEVETQLIFDTERHHYQLVNVGWKNDRRVYGCFLHLDIKDGKVWLQHNGTENEVGEDLANLGIPKQDIVIGFHSPFKRQFTDYAVG